MVDTATARRLWIRAVELGHRGAVARGRAVLDSAEEVIARSESAADRSLLALVASTRASWLRQSGRHGLALGPDGRAALLATAAIGGSGRGIDDDGIAWQRAALGDALIGLAADNLGLGRFDASTRLLERAASVIDPSVIDTAVIDTAVIDTAGSDNDWLLGRRVVLRWHWVGAENALYRGDAQEGRRRAGRAVELARSSPSEHHRLKTTLIAAAAAAADGDAATAVTQAHAVISAAEAADLVPLRWAGWQLVSGLDPSSTAQVAIEECDAALRTSGFFPPRDFNPNRPDG